MCVTRKAINSVTLRFAFQMPFIFTSVCKEGNAEFGIMRVNTTKTCRSEGERPVFREGSHHFQLKLCGQDLGGVNKKGKIEMCQEVLPQERCSASLVIREMQVRATGRYLLTLREL